MNHQVSVNFGPTIFPVGKSSYLHILPWQTTLAGPPSPDFETQRNWKTADWNCRDENQIWTSRETILEIRESLKIEISTIFFWIDLLGFVSREIPYGRIRPESQACRSFPQRKVYDFHVYLSLEGKVSMENPGDIYTYFATKTCEKKHGASEKTHAGR